MKKPGITRPPAILSGAQLLAASQHLKSARLALLNWTREVYELSDNVDMHVHVVQEVLHWADQLESMRGRMEVKASIFGHG